MMFEGDDALKKISVLSGGERSRVVLGKILATPTNLLLLDEPTNHLDVESVEALTEALEEFDGAVLIVTHSEEILRRLATRLVVFQGGVPFLFEGSYDDFLERVGWEEEQGSDASVSMRGSNKKNKPKNKQKEEKREKAELLQERSRTLTPLKKEVEQCEVRISSLESQIAQATEQLAEASKKGDAAEIRRSSHELAELKSQLEKTLSLWEGSSERLAALEKEFEASVN
jgi:ATP-binding cassette subfamily F protein 3